MFKYVKEKLQDKNISQLNGFLWSKKTLWLCASIKLKQHPDRIEQHYPAYHQLGSRPGNKGKKSTKGHL